MKLERTGNWKRERRVTLYAMGLLIAGAVLLGGGERTIAQAQEAAQAAEAPAAAEPLGGGRGSLLIPRGASQALRSAVFGTPAFPLTGQYPLYPGGFVPVISQHGPRVGPVRLHPHVGYAQMFTDNVFRTNEDRESDFVHTIAPGIQAQLPFLGRHVFVADYRTNIQFYQDNTTNNVQDQTAMGRLNLDFPGGLKVDLQGGWKLGHDPRGTALDLQFIDINKWSTNSFLGQAEYQGARFGVRVNLRSIRWNFLNNNQNIIRNRLSNGAGITLFGKVMPKTDALIGFTVGQNIYDQNKNLDNAIYTVSGGARWEVTGKTTGQLRVGMSWITFTNAPVDQPPPLLSQFEGRDTARRLFVSGAMTWKPTTRLTVSARPFRTIQQTAVAGTSFFTATGLTLSATQKLPRRFGVTGSVGFQQDDFSAERTDNTTFASAGLTYRTVKWLGASLQYVFENRNSDVRRFDFHANTVMLAIQGVL